MSEDLQAEEQLYSAIVRVYRLIRKNERERILKGGLQLIMEALDINQAELRYDTKDTKGRPDQG